MHGNEGELEAAGEEAEHQKVIAAVAEGFRQRLFERLRTRGPGPAGFAGRRRQRQRERQDEQHDAGEHDDGGAPVEGVDERAREWREQELAERAGRRAGAECERPPVVGHELAERPDHQVERTARQAETDENAGRELEHRRRRGIGHEHEAERIEQRPGPQDANRAEAVRHSAGEWLADAPQQILDGDREREHVAAPIARDRQRREELAESRARAEAQQGDDAAASHHESRCAPADSVGGGRLGC
jgi:hypothetical protein